MGGSRSAVARLAAVALDASKSRIIDATTGEGAAPSDDSLRKSLDALPPAGTVSEAAELSRALDTRTTGRAVLSGASGAVDRVAKTKVVNPLLAPPAVLGPLLGRHRAVCLG